MQVRNSLYFNPSYITARYDVIDRERSKLQLCTRIRNFESNAHKGRVSKQSLRKIRLAVQWLVFLADKKKVTCPTTKKEFDYRAGVLTLSLPTGCEDVPAKFFRDTLLPSFLKAANYQFDLSNYVWKIELQKRGALHAHLTIDKFLPWEWVRETWCKILYKHSLLEPYINRFAHMSLREYIAHRIDSDNPAQSKKFPSYRGYIKSLVKAYKHGVNSQWRQPNCTDIHSVKNVRSLASYMCKYMSKDPGLPEGFTGRYWACSHSLSKLRTIRVDVQDEGFTRFVASVSQVTSGHEDIYYISKITNEPRFLGAIFFLERSIRKLFSHPVIGHVMRIVKDCYARGSLADLPTLYLDHALNFFQPQLKPIANAN